MLHTSDVPILVSNPIVAGESVLRTHLLPGLVLALRHNEGQQNPNIRLVEFGHVFRLGEKGEPEEDEHLGVLLAGQGDGASTAVVLWRAIEDAFGLARGATVLEQEHRAWQGSRLALGLHPSRSAALISTADGDEHDGTVIGAIGEVDPMLLESFGLGARRVGWLLLDVGALLRGSSPLRSRDEDQQVPAGSSSTSRSCCPMPSLLRRFEPHL